MDRYKMKLIKDLCQRPFKIVLGLLGATFSLNTGSAQALPDFYLPYPADSKYQVTQGWGGSPSHTDSYNKYAVDFGMSIGQPVASVASGKVIRSSKGKTNIAGKCDIGYVNNAHYVVVDHGENVSSLYLHLSQVDVSVGDTINQGQIIGKSGNTGYVCGPHLHFSFQKTNTVGTYAGESIGFGFVETGKGAPQSGTRYTSKNSTVQLLELKATPPSGAKQCIEVDGTKVGVIPNASIVKVGSCRPIQEQQFQIIDDGGGFRRFELKATPPSGAKQCIEVDGTKVGVIPNASIVKVGSCRPIQEQQFQPK